MVADIMGSISVALYDEFGDGYEIYFSKDVRQGLTEPCFFIALMESSTKRVIGRRYRQDNSFDIHYFPVNNADNTEMVGVAGRLNMALEFVTLQNGDLLGGALRHYSIVDGVLHFFVDYNVFLKKTENGDPMEELEYNEGLW